MTRCLFEDSLPTSHFFCPFSWRNTNDRTAGFDGDYGRNSRFCDSPEKALKIPTFEKGCHQDDSGQGFFFGKDLEDPGIDSAFDDFKPYSISLSGKESLDLFSLAHPQNPAEMMSLFFVYSPEAFAQKPAPFKAQPGQRHPTNPPFPVRKASPGHFGGELPGNSPSPFAPVRKRRPSLRASKRHGHPEEAPGGVQ